MPVLHPAEIWQQSGRWDGIAEMFKLKDRYDRDMCLGDDPRRGRGVARGQRDPLVPRLATDLVPDPDQGTGRGPPALRRPSDPRVPDEGFLHARPRCRGARGVLQRPQGRLLPDLRSVRPPVCRRAVGSRHDGGLRLARVHGPERGRGGRRRPVRRVRICRQCRAGPRRALDARRSRLGARPRWRPPTSVPSRRCRHSSGSIPPSPSSRSCSSQTTRPSSRWCEATMPCTSASSPVRSSARRAPRGPRRSRLTWASRPARWDRLARAG